MFLCWRTKFGLSVCGCRFRFGREVVVFFVYIGCGFEARL